MSSRTESIEAVRARIIDPGRTGGAKTMETADVGRAVDNAVSRYSKDRPRELITSFTGSASHYYDMPTNLPAWIRGFSAIIGVDYPAASLSDNEQPQWLAGRDWEVYASATDVEYLYFPVHTPGTAETVRINYTAPHSHTDSTDTIYAGDLEAVRDLGASIVCEMLATRASGMSHSGISADSVNYRDAQLRYTQEAKAWYEKYRVQMGFPSDGSSKACGIVLSYPSERANREGYILHDN
jgi:hypothetical protein